MGKRFNCILIIYWHNWRVCSAGTCVRNKLKTHYELLLTSDLNFVLNTYSFVLNTYLQPYRLIHSLYYSYLRLYTMEFKFQLSQIREILSAITFTYCVRCSWIVTWSKFHNSTQNIFAPIRKTKCLSVWICWTYLKFVLHILKNNLKLFAPTAVTWTFA